MPKPVLPSGRPWAVAAVANLKMASSPVGLPGTPYAYAIEVASTSPISPEGQLVRLDLWSGRVAGEPNLPSASALTVIGDRMAVLVPTGSHYELRFAAVARAEVRLSAGVELDWTGWPPQLLSSPLALVRGGIWLASAQGATLFSVRTGRVLAALGFRAEVSDPSESPAGDLVYVALDELSQHPLAKVSTMVDELDATTGRLLAHYGIDFGVGRRRAHPGAGRRLGRLPHRDGGQRRPLPVPGAGAGALPCAGTPVRPGPSVRERTDHGLGAPPECFSGATERSRYAPQVGGNPVMSRLPQLKVADLTLFTTWSRGTHGRPGPPRPPSRSRSAWV